MSLLHNPLFQAVRRHCDCMLTFGRDPSAENPSPLFASVVDGAGTTAATFHMPPPPGVRFNDFSWAGNNLMHDVPFLEVLLRLSELTEERAYAQAVDEVFAYYPQHCPHPETGLFPWGEHAQWSFSSRRILANACHDPYVFRDTLIIHDHLRHAPAWFWERMWASSPEAVVRYAHGLDFHIMNPETMEHNRHAPLAGQHWNEIPYTGKGKDFARHAGFFIFETLFAWEKSGDIALRDWALAKLQYHLDHRHPNGVLRGQIRTEAYEREGQHDSFACSLLDIVRAIDPGTSTAQYLQATADELLAVREKRPLEAFGQLRPDQDPAEAWIWRYSHPAFSALNTSVLAQVYRRTGFQSYADAIVEAANLVLQAPLPAPGQTLTMTPISRAIDTLSEAADITDDPRYLEQANALAGWVLEQTPEPGLLPGAVGITWYGNINSLYDVGLHAQDGSAGRSFYLSTSGTPSLVRSLLRLALLEEGEADVLGTDDHVR